jgi:WD40 repeat protein
VLDPESGRRELELRGHSEIIRALLTVTASSTGRLVLVTASSDGTARVRCR